MQGLDPTYKGVPREAQDNREDQNKDIRGRLASDTNSYYGQSVNTASLPGR